jgi:uncharacterized protein (TIGR02421 family)
MHSTAELCAQSLRPLAIAKCADLQGSLSGVLVNAAKIRDNAGVEHAVRILEACASGSQLLPALAWDRTLEEAFLRERSLPEPVYNVDRGQALANLEALSSLQFDHGSPLGRLLGRIRDSYALTNRMLLAVGTRAFHTLSAEAYGHARTGTLDHVAFAEHLEARLGVETYRAEASLSAQDFADDVHARLIKSEQALVCDIELVPTLASKVIAGSTRMRVRSDARFGKEEARGLFHHEVETHLLTAQNGAQQEKLPFLRLGGPRATRTQEGLAVFSEFYAKAMTSERLRRLIVRVKLVDMAERGADFVELVAFLEAQGATLRDAYHDAVRICRGGLCTGGAPFTKDLVYLAGFLDVYRFLSQRVAGNGKAEAELLVCGRITLDDVKDLAELCDAGMLHAPTYRPLWLRQWDDLLTHFAVTSFLTA